MSVSSRVSKERIKKGLTQEELAGLTNITVRTIQRIESGESTPRMFTLKAIAAALEIPFESFIEEEKTQQVPAIEAAPAPEADAKPAAHFLHVFCLSCFSYIAVPYVHFLIPSYLLKKSTESSMAVRHFAQKVLRQQITWVVLFHLLLILALVYNFLQAKYGRRQFLVNYLWVVFFMYFLNAMVIAGNLLKAKKLSLSKPSS